MHWYCHLLLLVALTLRCHSKVREPRQARPDVQKWENNQLNFYFANNLPFEFRAMFRDAVTYIADRTCIGFELDPNQILKYKVRIQLKEDTCSAGSGQRNSILNFGYNCAAFGVAVHELMHVLGIAHGQARDDRDDYLVVDSEDHNDEKENVTYNPVPFDYGSVMLYERTLRSYPKDPEYNYTMGSLRVAFYDMMLINKFYECSCPGPELKCQNGGYQNPADCSKCLCTDGFKGPLCEEIDGNELHATTEWQKSGAHVERLKGIPVNTIPPNTYFAIISPPNSTIQVQITKLSNFFCQSACDYNGVEIKYKEDRRITSPLVCCDNDNLWNKTRTSTRSPLIVVKYGNIRGPVLEFRYRYVNDNGELSNRIDVE